MPANVRPVTHHSLFTAILLAYLIIGALYAIFTPDWQAPDEPAHYNYIAQVVENGCCPVIEIGDWDSAYLSRLTDTRFAPELLDNLDTIQYEDHQPPLYYLLATPLFRLTAGDLTALRLFSVLLGAGVVLSTYAAGMTILPGLPAVGLGAAAFVAFLPQHVAMLAAVNNDALAELVIGATLWAALICLKGGAVKPWHLGLLVGIGFVTKATTYFMAGVVPLALMLRWWTVHDKRRSAASWRERYDMLRPLLRAWGGFLLPALILGGVWWGRNLEVYGFPDFLGLQRHDLVVAGQPRTAERIAAVGWEQYLRDGMQTTFNSFWGQFGWMALPLPGWTYRLLQVLLLAVIGGLLPVGFVLRRRRTAGNGRGARRYGWVVLGAVALLASAQFVYYNTGFLQLQGRYLFPALIPFGLWIALGLDGWRRWLLERYAWSRWLAVAALAPLAALDVWLLWRVVVPLLSP